MDYHLSSVKLYHQKNLVPDAYHHGDLRRALLDAASDVLEAEGVGALSLRDLARRAGVSATAPYHHFKGKSDLIGALVEDTMQALDAALAAPDHADSRQRLRDQGVAYVLFAVEHPERFRLAFRPELCDAFTGFGADGTSLNDTTVGFGQLVRAVREVEPDPERQRPLALAAWSLAHGLAALLVDGPLRPLAHDHTTVRALAEATVDQLTLP